MSNQNINSGDVSADSAGEGWFKSLFTERKGGKLREAIKEYIERTDEAQSDDIETAQEKSLITNIFKLKGLTAEDVMLPRTDIVSIELGCSKQDLLDVFLKNRFSRILAYKESLDHVVGVIHIKDVFEALVEGRDFSPKEFVKDIPIYSPALPVLELLMIMQQSQKHAGLIIDEHGGTDGLVTIGDVMEVIVGNIDDEFVQSEQPEMFFVEDRGYYICDARYDIDDFFEKLKIQVDPEQLDEIETVGGLLFTWAGRVPIKGEILKMADVGVKVEILDADPRKVQRIKVIPIKPQE